MNEILLNYLVQGILGGASGYITNDYAINMLFKEYTPLKLGGVIKKTRHEFIENLSSMVENDIINKEKLHEILSSDEFKDKFEKVTDDFYENCLYEALGSDKFSDLEGFDSTMLKTHMYVKDLLDDHADGLIDLTASNFKADDFLTGRQTQKIADSLYETIRDLIENTRVLEDTLLYLYENNKESKLSDILGPGANIEVINDAVKEFGDIAAARALDSKLGDLTGFNEAVGQALDIFYDKQLKDIIDIKGFDIDSLISSLISKEPNIIYKICQSLFAYGRNLDKSIYSFLDPGLETSLKNYTGQNLPYITDRLAAYVEKNSMLIDRIIEDSIDEVIEESDGLRAKLLSAIKDTYFNNLSKKYSIVDKIVSFIRKAAQSEKLSINISKMIIDRLDTLTLADIIKEAEDNNFSPDKAYDLLMVFINKNGRGLMAGIEGYISNLQVKDILPGLNLPGEKILSSPMTGDLLISKSAKYTEAILTKDLSDLFSPDQVGLSVNKAGSYLKAKFREKENAIKSLISELIKTIDADEKTLKKPELADFIKGKAYNKYREEAGKLKNMNLSLAIDKLNTLENISKNSSETLQKFMINNTDTILKGSIKGIVTDNLNKLTDDELITFANDFIGRELKPIMFFGGLLGLIAGLVLAGFQNSPLRPGEINPATMATYAFVGFITNVVAINMIFRPYREIKFLSKLPFLRNFSLGYIIKNQKNFANSTAHYIDTSLLSKKSINELFEKHSNKIKESFIESIREGDYQTLTSLLIKNKKSIITAGYGFLKNKLLQNLSKLFHYLHEKASQIKLSSLITENNIKSLCLAGKNLIKPDKLSRKLYSAIRSEKKLQTLIPADFVIGPFNSQAAKVYNKTIEFLEPDKIKEEILKYDEKYQSFSSKTLQEGLALTDEKLSELGEKASEIILSQTFKNNVSLAAIRIFNRTFDRTKTFEELFDGRGKIYLDKNLPQILNSIAGKIKDSLIESRKAVSASLAAEFKNKLTFIERGMFSFMGGDQVIDQIVSKIMTDKLPKFMDAKNDEINGILRNFIEEKFYKARVEVLYTRLNSLRVSDLIENYLSLNREKIEGRVNKTILELYRKTENKEIKALLKVFKADDLGTLLKAYENEIDTFANIMHGNLMANKNEIDKEAASFIRHVSQELLDLKISHIFRNASPEDLDIIIRNSFDILNKNDHMDEIIRSFLVNYKVFHDKVHLDYFIDWDEFAESGHRFINELIMKPESEKTIKDIMYSLINNAAESNFSFIDSKSKDHLVNIFVDSSIESLRRNLDEILGSVEFDKIAAEEIEKMEPKKIHQMFESFGGKYFRRLMLYGFGGFVFGINMYVGFALTGLKIVSQAFKKDR